MARNELRPVIKLRSTVDGTVRRTVRDAGGTLGAGDAPLVDDCACCALREDLLADAEYAAWPSAWKSLPPASDELLDPVS